MFMSFLCLSDQQAPYIDRYRYNGGANAWQSWANIFDVWPNIAPQLHQTSSQQTQDVEPVLVSCWSTVRDAGPTLNQHCFNVSCLMVCQMRYEEDPRMLDYCWPKVTDCGPAFRQHWSSIGPASPVMETV